MGDDLETARKNLNDIKTSFRNFLNKTYEDEKTAANTFDYLSKAVRRAIKKESIKIEFLQGGDVSWYMNIFHYLSNWLEAEKKTSDLLNRELETITKEDLAKEDPDKEGLNEGFNEEDLSEEGPTPQ